MMRSELRVPSDLKFLTVIEEWLLGFLRIDLEGRTDWPKWENRLRLVIVEAYSNVVRHAHQNRPQLPVVLKLELSPDCVHIEVWDQGQGFDLGTYLPPAPEQYQEGGYGWMILNRLMDKVEYQAKGEGQGNCLRLQAHLPSDRLTSPLSSPRKQPH